MLKWLSNLDVNAVFAALMAAWAYLHNHSFRKQVAIARGDLPPSPPSASASTVAIVLVVALVCIASVIGACATLQTPKSQAILHAEEACVAEDLASLRSALANAQTSANKATVFVEVGIPALICAALAIGAKPSPEAAGSGSAK